MLVSYKWLQTYFKEPLPRPAELVDLLNMKVFEVEGIEEKRDSTGSNNGDVVLDIKVLPDRASYCLSHRYIAHEIGVAAGRSAVMPVLPPVPVSSVSRTLGITIEDVSVCRRYMGRVVEGVSVGASPDWLREKLEVLGQRSINVIVDMANFVMLDTGQPLHAFDAHKVEGNIVVRLAKVDEEIVILDGSTVKLTPATLVVADSVGPLAIAGVKGGKRAEVTETTKSIILESANFNGARIRKTSQIVGIRNDSSKRFENEVTPERAELAMTEISALIKEATPSASLGDIIDIYPTPVTQRTCDISISEINSKIGTHIPRATIIDILKRCDVGVEDKGNEKETSGDDMITLTIPLYRSDLVITEDIVDEVGRIFGYENVPAKIPQPIENREINKHFYYYNLIRKTLVEQGFSEIYTYTLKEVGDVQLQNPLNSERGYLRNDLASMMQEKLMFNLRNIDLLGLNDIRMFEIGHVFGEKKERASLAIGVVNNKGKKGEGERDGVLSEALSALSAALGVSTDNLEKANSSIEGIREIDIDAIVDSRIQPTTDTELGTPSDVLYAPVSIYPCAVRDIAVFVPGEVSATAEEEIVSIIKTHGDNLLVREPKLFDTFTKKKEGEPTKTSYAYRVVFQAHDRTLTEGEINRVMEKITHEMNGKEGWQVR